MQSLIAGLSAASGSFRAAWARADVGYRYGVCRMRHPRVGELDLYQNQLNVPTGERQHLLMYRAEPGSDSARALEELRSISAAAVHV